LFENGVKAVCVQAQVGLLYCDTNRYRRGERKSATISQKNHFSVNTTRKLSPFFITRFRVKKSRVSLFLPNPLGLTHLLLLKEKPRKNA